MNETEIDAEIERLQKMKKEMQEVKLPRAEKGRSYYYVGSVYQCEQDTDSYLKADNLLYKTGNYYLDKAEAQKRANHARFESEVKAYLRALNDGFDFWPNKNEAFYLMDSDAFCRASCYWHSSQIFKAPELHHLNKAVEKFGKENFIKFFFGQL